MYITFTDLPAFVPGGLLVEGAPNGLGVHGHEAGGEREHVVPGQRHGRVTGSLNNDTVKMPEHDNQNLN